jgi:organic radical activating enzyme
MGSIMKKASHFKPLVVSNLDVHVVNSCNLPCHGCNHLANYGYDELFAENELVDWIEPWKNRLQFKRISLSGGEPLLNPNLKDICIAFRRLFPSEGTKLRITTNGILITKSPWLRADSRSQHPRSGFIARVERRGKIPKTDRAGSARIEADRKVGQRNSRAG